MTTWIIWNIYQEATILPRSVDAADRVLAGRNPKHIFVDGAYPDFEAPERLSTDGTRGFAYERGVLLSRSDTDECAKRNAALTYIDSGARDGDYVLYLDADEELTMTFGWPEQVGTFTFTRESRPEIAYDRCRLYRWEPGLHFKDRHYDLYRANGELLASLDSAPVAQSVGFGIHHDTAHDAARKHAKALYYRQLRVLEGHPAGVRA